MILEWKAKFFEIESITNKLQGILLERQNSPCSGFYLNTVLLWTAKKYFFRLCSLCLINLYSNDLASFQGCIVKFKGVIQKWHHTTRGSGKPLKISHSIQMFFNKLKAILSSPWRKMVIIITTKWHCEFIIHFWVSLLLNSTYSKTLNPCVTY